MAGSTEVKIYPKLKKVCKAVAREMRKLTQGSPQPRFDIALSGGNTPKKLFELLAERHRDTIPWEHIHFWWGDERCVPPGDEESNFKMANDLLFSQVPVPPENIHRIKGENPPKEEARRYAAEIDKNLNHRGKVPVFDLILLGLGDDGHTASIFPDQLEVFKDDRICVATRHPASGQNRITLTGKVLNNANMVYFMASGGNKSMRVSEIMNNDKAARLLPAYYVEPKNGSLIWFIDEPAASKIS